MFKFIVLFALVACVAAVSDDASAEVISYRNDATDELFDYDLQTSNGIHQRATGDHRGHTHGSYEYTSPEGVLVQIGYIADENGYQPSGVLLPTPPPTPAAILKAIEYLNSHPSHE